MDDAGNIIDIRNALKHPKAGVRIRALEYVLAGSPADLADTLPLLNDLNKNVRLKAVTALATYHDQRAAAAVGDILLQDQDPSLCKQAAYTLGSLNLPESLPYLGAGLKNSKAPTVQMACIKALGQLGGPEAVKLLIERLSMPTEQNLKAYLVTTLGNLHSDQAIAPLLEAIHSDDPGTRKAALRSLYQTQPSGVLEPSLRLLKGDVDATVRRRAAEILGSLHNSAAVPGLVQALFDDINLAVQATAQEALVAIDGWQLKTDAVLCALSAGNRTRDGLNGAGLCRVMAPGEAYAAGQPYLLTDYLIGQAPGQDSRMLAILAELIISSLGGSQERAGSRLNIPAVVEKLSPEILQELRIHIGGKTALDPIMQELRKNLDLYFQKPIHELNQQTQASWHSAIVYAQIGFIVRMAMSVAVFIVGLILLWLSARQLITGQLAASDLFGPGITFVSGMGSILLVIYSGPLREIRQSVSDLGSASAAFIAYTHRVLQISHTFSSYYITQKLTFEEMEKSSQLIGEAMEQTVKLLNLDGKKYSEAFLQKAAQPASRLDKSELQS